VQHYVIKFVSDLQQVCGFLRQHYVIKFVSDLLQVDLQLPMQSVPITTKFVSLNPTMVRCTRYNIMW